MKDDLTYFVNGRQPQLFLNEKPHFFCKWKTNNFLVIGRQQHFYKEMYTTSIFLR